MKNHALNLLCQKKIQEILVNLLKFHSHKQQESLHHNQTNQTNYLSSSTVNISIIFPFTQINLVKYTK